MSKKQTKSIVWLQVVADCVLPAKSQCPEGTLITVFFLAVPKLRNFVVNSKAVVGGFAYR